METTDKTLVDESCQGRYPIRPENIDINQSVFLGSSNQEIVARRIIGICQKKDGWLPVTENDLSSYEDDAARSNPRVRVDRKWDFIIFCADGKYRITHEFVMDSYRAAPKWESWQNNKMLQLLQRLSKTTKIILWIIVLFIISPLANLLMDNISDVHPSIFTRVVYMLNGMALYAIFRAIFPSSR